VTVGKIYDGLSTTLLISENLLAGGWGDASPVVALGTPESKVKLTTAFCWFNTETPTTDMRINGNRPTANALTPELLRPSSNHPGGVNVSFADGHTQYLRDNIAYHVYKQLMTPNNKKSSNSNQSYILVEDNNCD
jgi:prepilin-type processing-associated H-X9-DG protein